MTNKEYKVTPEITNINSDDPVFYSFSIKASKCSGSCDNINDPYAKMCVPHVIKNLNVELLILMPETNASKHIEWCETCKCLLLQTLTSNFHAPQNLPETLSMKNCIKKLIGKI